MMAFSNPYAPVVTQVSLPFCSPVPGGLTIDKQIQIQGVVQDNSAANGFSINLCEQAGMEPNCSMHFNPRFSQGCVVRNAMEDGCWGWEERDGGMPIMKGQPFEIIILCASSGYFIAVNGRHFTEFKHRLPMAKAKYLFIDGQFLKINFIKYEGGSMPAPAPAAVPGAYGFGPGPGVAPPPYTAGGFFPPGMKPPGDYGAAPGSNILYNPPVPLTHRIPDGMRPNRMIFISAVANPDAKRFFFNLQSGPSGNINFHFDVRINYGNDRKVVVRNTCTNGGWGPEERSASCFPFSPNASFDMIILAEAGCFKVAVNNTHFISYSHRQPLKKSDTLCVKGDVRITSLRFQ
ncbi:galectin-4-like [Babylonia areolata]|uniref:galectin-4-like n=1 Tax=Babylonia areolata TaxID=304850 RepID=UPI003FCF7E39